MPNAILLVASDPQLQTLVTRALVSHDVRVAGSAPGALTALGALTRSDAAMVILHTSVVDWRTILDRVREGGGQPRPAVVLVAGASSALGEEPPSGIDEVMSEAIAPSYLLTRINTLLASRQATAALLERCGDLERLARDQRDCVELIVHDLKNPIAVAQANVSWSQSQLLPDQTDLHEALADSHEALRRLQAMADDLLAIAHLDHSKLAVERVWVPISQLLDDVISTHRRAASVKNVSLSVRREENLGILGDPVLLRRVVDSIVESSLRSTPAAGRVELKAIAKGGVEIAVSNTGRPIPAEDRGRIFDKLAQGEGAGRRVSSAGLGLYFCKRAIEAHRGQIEVVETEEFATSFVMRIPAA